MNLNYNCKRKIYMEPAVHVYVEVRNKVQECTLFCTIKYFYDGNWIEKTSPIFIYGEYKRIYYQRSSSNRDLTIYKRLNGENFFIYNTIIYSDNSVCYEVTGSNYHTFINQVQC